MDSSAEYIGRISREYGLYILDSRAIPSMTDGLKTSQRIALWLLRDKSSEVKTIALAGEMISSKLYVHGDSSAADTISYLAAPYLNNCPLVQGEGQFGTRVAPVEGIGAPRYTEVKRSKFADANLYLDLDVLPMTENYDGSKHMPATFLPLVPLVLLNGVKGIATGWSTEILPRRFSDLQQAVQDVLKTGKVQTPLLPHYDRYNLDIIRSDENPNKYILRGRLKIKNTSTVIVTELPPDVTLDSFKERLIQLEEDGKIVDFTDNTTDTIDIEIKMRRSALEGKDESALIELFKLRSIVTERIVVLDETGRSVRQYESAEKLVEDFVKWRLEWFLVRYQYLAEVEQQHSIFWFSMLACFAPGSGPVVASMISEIKSKNDLKEKITEAIKANDIPLVPEVVEKIATLPVYRWTKEGLEETERRLEECLAKIEEYDAIISSSRRRKTIYRNEVSGL